MYFEDFNALINMSGHGFYVWLAYGISFVVCLFMLIFPMLKKRKVLRNIAARKQVQQQKPVESNESNEGNI